MPHGHIAQRVCLSLTTERKESLTAQVSSLHLSAFSKKDGCVPVCANLAATRDPDEPSSKILRKTARTSEFSALMPWSADRTPWDYENAAQVSLSCVNPRNNRNGFPMVFASDQLGSFTQLYIAGEKSITCYVQQGKHTLLPLCCHWSAGIHLPDPQNLLMQPASPVTGVRAINMKHCSCMCIQGVSKIYAHMLIPQL